MLSYVGHPPECGHLGVSQAGELGACEHDGTDNPSGCPAFSAPEPDIWGGQHQIQEGGLEQK